MRISACHIVILYIRHFIGRLVHSFCRLVCIPRCAMGAGTSFDVGRRIGYGLLLAEIRAVHHCGSVMEGRLGMTEE